VQEPQPGPIGPKRETPNPSPQNRHSKKPCMIELEQQLRRINDKLQQLLRQRDSLLKENGKLKEEIRSGKEQQAQQIIRLEQLQQQVEIQKASKGEMNETEEKALDKRLSQYIREIDRCIALLGE
jgi:chromosome segregation ATPase